MRRLYATTLAAACLMLVGVAACQSGTVGGAALSTSTTTTAQLPSSAQPGPIVPPQTLPTMPTKLPSTDVPLPPASGTPVPPGQVHTSGMLTQPQTISVAGDDVVFVAAQSGCEQITAEATAQTSTSVTILVITTLTTRGNQMCPMYVLDVPLVVRLNAPLGNRSLLFEGVTKHG